MDWILYDEETSVMKDHMLTFDQLKTLGNLVNVTNNYIRSKSAKLTSFWCHECKRSKLTKIKKEVALRDLPVS